MENRIVGSCNNVSDTVEKALGVLWIVQSDMLSIRVSLELGNKRSPKSISLLPQLGLVQLPELVDTPCVKLNLRICLSIHAKTFDPLGWYLPTRMVGNILFWETLQELNANHKGPIQWDVILPENLVLRWKAYFRMLHGLADIKMP